MTHYTRRARYRKLFPFQLDLNKTDEYEIALEIQDLKRKRDFSRTIRDGIRLICDLRRGRLEVLQELFPWVLEQQAEASVDDTIEKVTSNTEDMLRRHIERLETLILQQGALPVADSIKPSDITPPRKKFTPLEDIQLEVKQSTNRKDNNASWNFMIASAAQVYGDFDSLPAVVIDYGLRTGRIPADRVKRKPAPTVSKNPKKLANADIPLSQPNFDDLDDLL